jgi:DNA-binding CsgD family transcriptional regulator
MSSQIARLLVQSFRRQGIQHPPQANLTPREEEILQLVSKGYRSKEVAENLRISAQTVETHLAKRLRQAHVRSRAAAVARFLSKSRRYRFAIRLRAASRMRRSRSVRTLDSLRGNLIEDRVDLLRQEIIL